MREDEATAGASDEREVEELDMELVVNHGRIARIRYAHVMLLIEFRQGAVSVARVFDPCNPMKTSMILNHELHSLENNKHFTV